MNARRPPPLRSQVVGAQADVVADAAADAAADTAAPALWRHGADLLLAVAVDGRVAAANPAWSALFGIDPDRLAGRPVADVLHPDDGATCSAALARARDGGRQRFAARVRDAHGGYHACAWTAAADGSSVYAIGREDADLPVEMAARTRRSLAMGRLAGGIAHDFNNLLQALRHTLELIRLRPADAAGVTNWAENGLRIVDRGGRLTAQLVAASGQRRDEAIAPVPVLPLLQSLAARLAQILGPHVAVSVSPHAVNGSVMADHKQLEAALLNLALNAGEAMPGGGTVTLGSARLPVQGDTELPSGDYVLFEVADTGGGMSDAIRERAFEPFFTTKAIGDGAGLGLAQVHGFARRHGGSVRIASSGGAGTALHLLLPALVMMSARPDHIIVSAGHHTDHCSEQLRLLGWKTSPMPDLATALTATRTADIAALVVAAGPDGDAAARLLQADDIGIVLLGGPELPFPLQLPALAAAIERAARLRR